MATLPTSPSPATTHPPVFQPSPRPAWILDEDTSIWPQPRVGKSEVCRLQQGAEVTWIQDSGYWQQIRVPRGATAWVESRHLSFYRVDPPDSADNGRVDWRSVTIEGFPAGVDRDQLKARLGKPDREIGGEFVYQLSFTRRHLSYYSGCTGAWLEGRQLESNGQVLAVANGVTRLRDVLAVLGDGRKGLDVLVYQNHECHFALSVFLDAHPSANPTVQSFCIFWDHALDQGL